MYRLLVLLAAAASTHGATINREEPTIQRARAGCEISVRMDLAGRRSPLILVQENGKWQLAQPTSRSDNDSFMNLAGKKILLTCPGSTLKLDNRKVRDAQATCTSAGGLNYFIIDGKKVKIDSVQCTDRIRPTELITGQSCSGDGVLLKLGYMVNNEMKDLITTCHRLADGTSYWSRHILNGFSMPKGKIAKRPDQEGRPQFSVQNKELFKGFWPKGYYDHGVQLEALAVAIGRQEAQQEFDVKKNKFFSKGHLTPNADFVVETWKDVTFLYVNVQPQWQEINGGNWNKLEVLTRNKAATTGKNYEVITGTTGNLTPRSKSVFLDYTHNKIPVPMAFTKLIREIETNKCIALVSTNFPQNAAPQPKCRDICSSSNWPTLREQNKAGYVYCCSYAEFTKAFPKSSPGVDCSGGILTNNGARALEDLYYDE